MPLGSFCARLMISVIAWAPPVPIHVRSCVSSCPRAASSPSANPATASMKTSTGASESNA